MQKSLTNLKLIWVAMAFVLVSSAALAGTLQEPNFTDTVFVSDATRMGNSPASGDGQVNGITSMAWAPDGANRLYVTVKGRADANAHIQVINNGVLQSVPFYTFNSGIETNNECGLLSLVFHPDYASGTRQIYCFVTVSNSEQRVVRFTETMSGGNFVATGAPTTIVSGIPTVGQNHDGGGLAIAPDQNGNGRFLYWAAGNSGNGVNVVSFTSLNTYTSPLKEPSDTPLIEIFSPLRKPWRDVVTYVTVLPLRDAVLIVRVSVPFVRYLMIGLIWRDRSVASFGSAKFSKSLSPAQLPGVGMKICSLPSPTTFTHSLPVPGCDVIV